MTTAAITFCILLALALVGLVRGGKLNDQENDDE